MILGPTTTPKRKVFVSYHHGGGQGYYDEFTKKFCDTYDVIADNSLERRIDSDDADYIRRCIAENNVSGSSCTIVLVGKDTWGRKYVDWEIKATLDQKHGLIALVLPTARMTLDKRLIVPDRLNDNLESGFAQIALWNDILHNLKACTQLIERANARDKKLIANTRDRRHRNA